MNEDSLIGEYAGFVSRAAAFVVDLVIGGLTTLAAILLVTTAMKHFIGIDLDDCTALQPFPVRAFTCRVVSWAVQAFKIMLAPVYFWFFWISSGQTPGKYLFGLRVVRLDGRRMTFLSCITRYLGYYLDAICLGLGFLNVLVDDRRQGWHDKLARTCVVYAWEAGGKRVARSGRSPAGRKSS